MNAPNISKSNIPPAISEASAGISHIAFIMDGNGRWATARGLPRHRGHQEGFKRVREIAQACRDLGIKAMSLYAFSTENWKRPQEEIDFLFKYLDIYLKKETKSLIGDDCRLMISGDVSKLPDHSKQAIAKALEATAHCKTYTLNICLNYGSRQEVTRAMKLLAADVASGKLAIDAIDESLIERHLYTSELPPLDLLIRTSGELRLSNFMLYQLAYSELMFPTTPWPDFDKEALYECLAAFPLRKRRYGGLTRE